MKTMKVMKRRQRETEEQAIERRKRMYGCDGKCYCDAIWDEELKCFIQGGVCGGIDKCGEFIISSCLVVLLVITVFVFVFVVIVTAIVFLIITGIGG